MLTVKMSDLRWFQLGSGEGYFFSFHVEMLHPELSYTCLDQYIRSIRVLVIQ